MLAVHLESGRVEVRRRPLPRVPHGFARVRLLAAGICSTDLELQRGYYGFSGTPGHEFVGEVTEAEDRSWVGKRVAGEINLACGACEWCARDLGRHCPHRTVLGIVKHPGAFREFLTLPVENLRPVPAAISDEQAVFIEPVAAACEILDQVRVPAETRVAVLGDGKLGLLIAQVLAAHGARVHLWGRHKEKMKLVESARVTTEIWKKSLPKKAWPMVVEATGTAEGLRAAIAMCEPRGTVVMKSTVHGLVKLDTAPAIVNEITLIGSRCGRFEPAIRLLASGKVRVDRLISERFPLDRAPEAFARAAAKGVLKILLGPADEMRAERREVLTLWCAAGVLAAGIIVYSQTLAFAWDEGFHLLAAQLILRGKLQYLDFMFAQAPLFAYWNAALMRVFGQSWRMVHVESSLAVTGMALLTAQFVLTRLEDRSWRLAGALCAMALVGLNSTILWYGTIGQPYGMCLLLVVTAFRLTVLAAEEGTLRACAGAGFCAGASAACSLLTAPFAPVLLLWTWWHGGADRFKKGAIFIGAAAIPFLPLLRLFVMSPRQVLFGVFQYHAFYRAVDWPGAGKQNVDVATAWMNNYEAVLLIGLAALGLTYIVGRSNWEPRKTREFYLCVWLIAAESAYLCIPRRTFRRYYMFVMPFLAMLSAVGLYAIAAQIGSLLYPWRYPLVLAVVMAGAFVKYSVDALNEYSWADLKQVAAKVDEVTAPGVPLYADEHIYFLTKREPPSGMEYMDSHKLQLPDAVADKMHVLSTAKLDAQVAAGKFATIVICNNDDRVMALGLPGPYAQHADVAACSIFWARK